MRFTLFELLVADPPADDQQHDFIHSVEHWLVPDKALPKLEPLAYRDDALGGWAAALLVPQMSEGQIIESIDRLGGGRPDFNFANQFGPKLGARIDGQLLDYFLESLDRKSLQAEKSDGFSAVIGGLPKVARDKLLKWSQRKSPTVRGIIIEGIRSIDDDPAVQRYLLNQLDRGLPEAVFSLYLGISFKSGEWRWWIPTYTDRRANKLIEAMRSSSDGRQRWIMELLRCLAQRDSNWSSNLARVARTESDLPLRRVLNALVPSRTSASVLRIVVRALKNVESLAPVEREFCRLIHQFDIEIDEKQVLAALRRDPRGVLSLLGDVFLQYSYERHPIKIRRIQNWIEILNDQFPLEEWISKHPLLLTCAYLGKAMQRDSQKKILLWANPPKNIARDFVLGLIFPHITGVTTDDLTAEASLRLLELYIKGLIEPFPSPGEVATERFVTDIVLPYAQSITDDRWEREAFERILLDAGRRHDRRYSPPWLFR